MTTKRLIFLLALAGCVAAGAATLGAQTNQEPTDTGAKRLHLKDVTPEGYLICAPPCRNPVGFCC